MLFYILHLMLGTLILLVGIIFKLFPPKVKDFTLAYRSRRAKLTQESWREANSYSANMFIIVGILSLALGYIMSSWHFRGSVIGTVFATFLMVLVGLYITEKHLEKHFDEKGNRKIDTAHTP